METLITKAQKLVVLALAAMLIIVVVLSTVHLGFLIAQEIWKPPRFLIPVQGLLDIFGYFLLVLIGVELLETLKAYAKKNVIHVRVVLEVALIAMARKVIVEEPNSVSSLTLLGIAALILALGLEADGGRSEVLGCRCPVTRLTRQKPPQDAMACRARRMK